MQMHQSPIIFKFTKQLKKYLSKMNSQVTNSPTQLEVQLCAPLPHDIARLCTFFDFCDSLCFCLAGFWRLWAWFWRCFCFGLFYRWSSLRTKETNIHHQYIQYIITGTTTRKTTQTGLRVPKRKAIQRLITRSWTEQLNTAMIDIVRHAAVDAVLFHHLSQKMKKTHQKGNRFCLLCCWTLSFSFRWPFCWSLSGSFGCNHRCLRVHRHRRY